MTGSVALEGMLDWLVSGEPEAVRFLENYRFECLPMVCVDGVIHGSTHSDGYGYGGSVWHYEKFPLEVQCAKEHIKRLAADGCEFVFAGKLHGGQRYTTRHTIDFMTASPFLFDFIKANPCGEWKPVCSPSFLTIRAPGFFERFMLDTFKLTEVFGCHVQGINEDVCRRCGADLMKTLAAYELGRNKA